MKRTRKFLHQHRGSVCENSILDTQTCVLVEVVEMNRLSLVWKLACGAETTEEVNEMQEMAR